MLEDFNFGRGRSGIYQIRNKVNGKIYIGKDKKFPNRIINHLTKLRNCVHDNKHLQAAWNKYGKKNFEYDIVIFCEVNELTKYEQEYIDGWQTANPDKGYNICPIASSCSEKPVSQETRKKLSKAMMGNTNGKGIIFTEERCKKISLSQIGKVVSDITRKRMSISNIGRTPPNRKFTAEKVNEIIEKYKLGYSQRKIAKEYGCTQSLIWRIVNHTAYVT